LEIATEASTQCCLADSSRKIPNASC